MCNQWPNHPPLRCNHRAFPLWWDVESYPPKKHGSGSPPCLIQSHGTYFWDQEQASIFPYYYILVYFDDALYYWSNSNNDQKKPYLLSTYLLSFFFAFFCLNYVKLCRYSPVTSFFKTKWRYWKLAVCRRRQVQGKRKKPSFWYIRVIYR